MSNTVFFLNGTYDDAMALLLEARNYVAYHQEQEERGLAPRTRVRISYETMRVTARLTQSMAWLLTQKAVQSGELSPEEAASDIYALSGHEVCLDTESDYCDDLPEGLKSLLNRSLTLYKRIDRLDDQVRRAVGTA